MYSNLVQVSFTQEFLAFKYFGESYKIFKYKIFVYTD